MKQGHGVFYFAFGAAALMGTVAQAQSENATPAKKPAWAAEATMNPDYVGSGAPAAPATPPDNAVAPAATDDAASRAAEEEAATEAKRKADQEAEAAADKAAQDAEAQRKAEEEAAAAQAKAEEEAAAAAKAADEAEALRKLEEKAAAEKAAADAEAKRHADEAAAKAEAEAKLQQAIESCRDALNAEVTAAKFSFANESWAVSRSGRAVLDKIVSIIADCGDVTIEVGGHTDSIGSDASNKRISQLRADSVVATLKDKGVDGAKLTAVGYGKDKPVASNDNADGRRQNRRIAFLVSAK